ncbi:MAG: hypothetical protein NTX71_06605 [Candidatus Aureabacteria bacterium]|nr:hypothetical protein [Candidatus Auribacterota bacterium]
MYHIFYRWVKSGRAPKMADNAGVAFLPAGRDSSDQLGGLDESSPYREKYF